MAHWTSTWPLQYNNASTIPIFLPVHSLQKRGNFFFKSTLASLNEGSWMFVQKIQETAVYQTLRMNLTFNGMYVICVLSFIDSVIFKIAGLDMA